MNMLPYVLVSLLLIHSQDSGTGRFEVVLFPVFLLIAQGAAARARIAPIVAALLVTLQWAAFVRFAARHWVA